jgi:molybdenum cofactor synthesis domain-containing protein
MVTAGILVIGNEVLSGKVEEENARYMVTALRELGISLMRIVVVRDDVESIAEEVRQMSKNYSWVFTSGGVGSTHDDVTLGAVAHAFGVELVEHPGILSLLEEHFGDRMNAAVRRMAQLPEGTEVLGLEELRYPVIRVRNVHVFPGVPEYLRLKFDYLKGRLQTDSPFVLRQIYLNVPEDRIAIVLAEQDAAFEDVEFGSYPKFDNSDYKTKLTVEGRAPDRVQAAYDALKSQLDLA